MDPRLATLQKKALADNNLRQKLLSTRQEKEPLTAFCVVARQYGCNLTEQELATLGEENTAAMLRSQNGGGEYEPCGGWDDEYELFFLTLQAKQ